MIQCTVRFPLTRAHVVIRRFARLCYALALASCGKATEPVVVPPVVIPPIVITPSTRPNVLLILADDFGAESSALYPALSGSGAVAMPTIAALAAKGLVFDNAWTNPMCSPTRAAVLTGLYGNRTGVTDAGDVMPNSATTIFEYVASKSAGKYDMAVFGKWHLGGNVGIQHVRDAGVPRFRGFLGSGVADYFNWDVVNLDGTTATTTTYATTAITDYAITFLDDHARTRAADPWFVYVAYNAPHTPNQVPPANLHSVNVGGLAPGTTANTPAVYKAMLQAMDTEIGRLLAKVDLTNTLVIFMGDNGTPANVKDAGSIVRGGKTAISEGGIRVPLVVAGAGVTRLGRDTSLIASTDVFATIGVAAGSTESAVGNSYSLQPVLVGSAASSGRTHAFTELCQTGVNRYAIRNGRYKLSYDTGTWALFDLVNDRGEATNLYASATVAATRTALESELAKIRAAATAGCFQ
jgi:arylsulfatase A-like enzyme